MGDGQKRNKPCHCGSGKKYKKCCYGRMPAEWHVSVNLDDLDDSFRVEGSSFYAINDGERLRLYRKNPYIFGEEGEFSLPLYLEMERAKQSGGRKVLARATLPPGTSYKDAREYDALEQYDRVFAIDTNTNIVSGRNLSVAMFIEFRLQNYPDSDGSLYRLHKHGKPPADYAGLTQCDFIGQGGFYFINSPTTKYENVGWAVLISEIQRGLSFNNSHQYAIVTDSDMGHHRKYNARIEPYCGRLTLPENFTLVYATEKGASVLNKMVGKCDKQSAKVLRYIKSGKIKLSESLFMASQGFECFPIKHPHSKHVLPEWPFKFMPGVFSTYECE